MTAPLYFLHERNLSSKARDLIHFDMDSIRQVVSARHQSTPTLWLADPDGYEQHGRLLRDSTSPRLLAYSPGDGIIYATDGCNSCVYPQSGVSAEISHELMERLTALIQELKL